MYAHARVQAHVYVHLYVAHAGGGGTGRLFNASAAAVADDRAVDLWTDRLIPNTATAALHAFHLACFMQGLGPILSCEVLTR